MSTKGILVLDLDNTLLRGYPLLSHMRRKVERSPFGKIGIKVAQLAFKYDLPRKSKVLRRLAVRMLQIFASKPIPLDSNVFNKEVLLLVKYFSRRGWCIKVLSSAPPEAYAPVVWVLGRTGRIEFAHAPTVREKLRHISALLKTHKNVIVLDDELLGGPYAVRDAVRKIIDALSKDAFNETAAREIGVHAECVLRRAERVK